MSFIFNLINFILPKKKGNVSYVLFGVYDDGLKYILEHSSYSKFVILSTNMNMHLPTWLSNNDRVVVVNKYSIRGFHCLFTSSLIYFTHGIYYNFRLLPKRRQKIINLWHGMPLKKIGALTGENIPPKAHVILSTSSFFRRIMARCFSTPLETVFVTGLPRNNSLLEFNDLDKLKEFRQGMKKIAVWMPTFRDNKQDKIFGFDNFNFERLNLWLNINQVFLYIKTHPNDTTIVDIDNCKNIQLIDNEFLNAKGVCLYEFLSLSDMLWTDYSSVYIDYMITMKPIYFLVPDIDSYSDNRGFIFDLDESTRPGIMAKNEEEFFTNLDLFDKYQYDKMVNFYHEVIRFDISFLDEV